MDKKAVLAAMEKATMPNAEMAASGAVAAWRSLDNPLCNGELSLKLGSQATLHDKVDVALPHYKAALATQLKALPAGHTSIASSYSGLANALRIQGKLAQAMAMHGKALAIRLQAYGSSHSTVGGTCYNMGVVAERQGNDQKALELYSRAVSCYRSVHGETHFITSDAEKHIERLALKPYFVDANAAKEQGDRARAVELYRKAAAALLAEEKYGPAHEATISALAEAESLAGWLFDTEPKTGPKIDGNDYEMAPFADLAGHVSAKSAAQLRVGDEVIAPSQDGGVDIEIIVRVHHPLAPQPSPKRKGKMKKR